jgi:hypothetical protein
MPGLALRRTWPERLTLLRFAFVCALLFEVSCASIRSDWAAVARQVPDTLPLACIGSLLACIGSLLACIDSLLACIDSLLACIDSLLACIDSLLAGG